MHTLLRNPLLRLLGALWWLPALAIAIGCTLGGQWLSWTLAGSGAALALVVGMAGAGWAHGGIAALCNRLQRKKEQHRFFCPHCGCFDNILYACGNCGSPVEAFQVETGAAYLKECLSCGEPVFRERKGHPAFPNVHAYCSHCHRGSDASVYHQRKVQVWGVLRHADLQKIFQQQAMEEKRILGVRCGIADDGTTLTVLIALEDLIPIREVLPSDHAVCRLDGIWIGSEPTDELEMGQILDAYLRVTESLPRQQNSPGVYLVQKEIPKIWESVLTSRFQFIETDRELTKHLNLLPAAMEEPLAESAPTYPFSSPQEAVEERIVSRE